ncbi:MarR family winged helix-turn-helix transcriptional regulator [Furfurilactobacillus curtus]|uniref:HTH marR-type domain-containing protein n=1 Tax=Furfurilactobacillus curtus TaxID=1746200 RepID=A0ABQ5JPU4_9LACO
MAQDQSKSQELNDLYSQLISFETARQPFDQRFKQVIDMHRAHGHHGDFPFDSHDMHNWQHWSEHFNHHFREPVRNVLSTIQKNPGINARTISGKLNLLPGTLSKYLKALIGRHLVKEETNPDNRREKFYYLTDNGEWLLALVQGAQSDDQQAKIAVFDEFNGDEQAVIIRFLLAMRHRNDD